MEPWGGSLTLTFFFLQRCVLLNPLFGKVRGQAVEDFISEAQDRSKNAVSKSLLAAFGAWQEQLFEDETLYESRRIMPLVSTNVHNS